MKTLLQELKAFKINSTNGDMDLESLMNTPLSELPDFEDDVETGDDTGKPLDIYTTPLSDLPDDLDSLEFGDFDSPMEPEFGGFDTDAGIGDDSDFDFSEFDTDGGEESEEDEFSFDLDQPEGEREPEQEFGDEGEDFSGFTREGEAEEEDPDFQGNIRTVKGANLVYKRSSEDGKFEELWIYNIGKDIKRETKIRRAILAGTDINPGSESSEDGEQSASTSTVGNVQFLHIVGMPS